MVFIRQRNNQIKFRLTDEELKKFNSKVEKSKLTKNEYLRKLVLKKEIIQVDGLSEITKELNRIGVNLNQIAKNVNSGMTAEKQQLESINKEFVNIWLLLKEFRQKVM